jgi:hypothetical protein
MFPDKIRRPLTAALVAALCIIIPAQAAQPRRRAVTPPAALGKLTADKITGTVVDDVTSQPVAFAHVKVGDRSASTDSAGKFEVKNVTSFQGNIGVEVTRSGYAAKTVLLTTGGDQVVTVRVTPTPTVRVRKVNGTTLDLDFESIEFGYPVVFSGYNSSASENFCRPNGSAVTIDRSQIRRVTGPATIVHQASCCASHDVEKVSVELKTGETTELVFVDTCTGIPGIDLIGRNHISGKLEYTSFTSIAEITFP